MTEGKNDNNDKANPFNSFLGSEVNKDTYRTAKPEGLVISSCKLNISLLNSLSLPIFNFFAISREAIKYIPPENIISENGSSSLQTCTKCVKETILLVEEFELRLLAS